MHIRLWSPQDLLFGEGRQAPTGAGLLDFEKLPHGYRHGGLQGLLLRHRGTLILAFYPSIPPSCRCTDLLVDAIFILLELSKSTRGLMIIIYYIFIPVDCKQDSRRS